jgi:hypothetical protein
MVCRGEDVLHQRIKTMATPRFASMSLPLVSLFLACCGGRIDLQVQSTGPGQVVSHPAYSIVEAGETGTVLDEAGGSDEALTLRGYDTSGREVWEVTAPDISEVPTNLPGVLLVKRDEGESSLVEISPAGQAVVLDRAHYLQPLSSSRNMVIYIRERSDGRYEVCTIADGLRRQVRLPLVSEPCSQTASADGSRAAVIQPKGKSGTLAWVAVVGTGRPSLVAVETVGHKYVALSPDGRLAILGDSKPELVAFGFRSGKPLPLDYGSYGVISRGSVLLGQYWDDENGSHMDLLATTLARGSLRLELSGTWRIHADSDLRFLTYVNQASGQAFIMSLTSGRRLSLSTSCQDAAPVGTRTICTVSRTGQIRYLDNPFTTN